MKTDIYDLYSTAVNDDEFISGIDKLAATEGDIIFQSVFLVLMDLQLEVAEAKQRWLAILKHRLLLSEVLARKFGLLSASCDYLSCQSHYLKFPKLTEISAHNQITAEAHCDSLTGLLNKNSFKFVLNEQMKLAQNSGDILTVLFADIDDFKQINDSYGHGVGDKVFQHLGKLIQKVCRKSDFAFRYGGDEFVIVMPNTDSADGLLLAKRLHRTVLLNPLHNIVPDVGLTISCGVASFPCHAKNGEDLLLFADRAMYQAKNTGKNKVCLYDAGVQLSYSLKVTHFKSSK
jgi:diguanylate cyclase (GGDEF)-like protein